MPLKRSSLVKAVGAAFKVLGDIPEVATIRRSTSSYDTATGINSITTTNQTIEEAVFTKYESFEVDKVVVLATDVKLIFQQSEVSTKPSLAFDVIIRNSSESYNILRVGEDPAAVTYTLQLRAV